ncbi:MAG: hypothetical protein CO108_03305 [Deltaproteobacteria bacterium CG_4_9_14_3_um_filter_63_12]|nr:MAG: hypothetical protein CO108_03305 [Deltaproteobacteria bacterium CG_4_9_14_3_um_filter_63_12]
MSTATSLRHNKAGAQEGRDGVSPQGVEEGATKATSWVVEEATDEDDEADGPVSALLGAGGAGRA